MMLKPLPEPPPGLTDRSVSIQAAKYPGEAVARANANVALAKYWGKRNEELNLPCTGSIAITLAGLTTTARVRFNEELSEDRIAMNGADVEPHVAQRVSTFLALARRRADVSTPAEVRLDSSFPFAAGLASSASTFAALAVATTHALRLSLSPRELSLLARRGSGSAARSIHGGYTEWLPGSRSDGADSFAIQLAPPEHWDLAIIVAITADEPKRVGSREGMARTVNGSPFFRAWQESHEVDLKAVRQGILDRDLGLLGRAAERNCLKMHAAAMASEPPLIYWNPATLAVIHQVRDLRAQNLEAYFTIDAGPQVKVLCRAADGPTVADTIARVPGVQRILLSHPGGAAELEEAG
jgi:diphosphomevalonate decarboxylase